MATKYLTTNIMQKVKRNYLKKFIPRYWSNDELLKIVPYLSSNTRIINVSGWEDKDKEGGCYRNYFNERSVYHISNYPSDNVRGGLHYDIAIDLNKNLSKQYINSYDCVFNHTVLEHVIDPDFSFKQMSLLTEDIIITVVPFKQKFHFENDAFGDYYRFTPFTMRNLHDKNGFTILYESYTPKPALDVYLFYVGSKQPEKHTSFPILFSDINHLNHKLGDFSAKALAKNIIARFAIKYLFR